MIRRIVPFAVIAVVAMAVPQQAEPRPGGGHAFRGSSRSGSSSSSGYRSRGSSSSSSSSYGNTSPATTAPPKPTYPLGTRGSLRDPALRHTWIVGSTADPTCSSGEHCKRDTDDLAGKWERLSVGRRSRPKAWELIFGGSFSVLLLGIGVWLGTRKRTGWTTAQSRPRRPQVSPRAQLRAIVDSDPDFSVITLEEEVQLLYVEAHLARGRGQLERLSPYLRPSARERLAALAQVPVTQVIVGGLRIVSVQRMPAGDNVVVELETNCTETTAEGEAVPIYAVERWALWRGLGVRTKPPMAARALRCPSCGAALETIVRATCGHCRQTVDDGRFDWVVYDIQIVSRETRSPVSVGAHAPEVGTNMPTRVDPGRDAGIAALSGTHGFTVDALLDRTRWIFAEMNSAWSSLQWQRARPLLGRSLFEMQRYWIEAYRALGLRNVTEAVSITDLHVAAVTSDRWYDAVTIRVFATGLDYTLRTADSTIVGGSRTQPRAYSEYWTLVRGRGGGGPGSSCPSCGAPVVSAASASCRHCGSTIESSHFDWVLARIEQDEAYAPS